MNDVATAPARTPAQELRQRFWTRIAHLKTVRVADLVRVHHHAQQTCSSPEESLVALGILTEDQVIELYAGERAA